MLHLINDLMMYLFVTFKPTCKSNETSMKMFQCFMMFSARKNSVAGKNMNFYMINKDV